MVKARGELTDEQADSVPRLAAARGISVADVIRESVEAYVRPTPRPLTPELRERALAAIGAFSGPTDVARRHDE